MSYLVSFNDMIEKLKDWKYALSFAILTVFFFIVFFIITRLLSKKKAYIIMLIFDISIIVVGFVTILLELNMFFFVSVLLVYLLVIVCIYAPDIRSYLWSKNKKRELNITVDEDIVDREKIENSINEMIKALQNMSKNDIGALIVLSYDNVPTQILDSGVYVNSDISSALIESIFFPKTPLHDGAMIINGTTIVSAGCFLPLSQNIDKIPKELGTRHRAGIGITENIDVTSIIVSEESGVISIAKAGTLTRYADTNMLKKVLAQYFWQDVKN